MKRKRRTTIRRQPKPLPPPAAEAAVPAPDASDSAGREDLEPGETLREAESEIGINEWMDAETGEPAEGQSPPHLEKE